MLLTHCRLKDLQVKPKKGLGFRVHSGCTGTA